MSKLISILGAGESGTGAAHLAVKQGYDVLLSDKGTIDSRHLESVKNLGIDIEQGAHTEKYILNSELIIKSPGIPDSAPIISKAKSKGIPVISEIEFAGYFSKAHMIGITGTNGKTTTSLLAHHILEQAGLDVGLAGNVGVSLAKQVAKQDKDFFVVELSSFQLDGIYDFRVNDAILLNITPDHLDRYSNLQEYIKSKFRITQNQTAEDRFIYCYDDPIIKQNINLKTSNSKHLPFSLNQEIENGAWADGNQIHIQLNQPNIKFKMEINQLTISGKHNTYNTMAAGIIANSLLIRKESIRNSLSDFRNIEHRLEHTATVKGINFINDSKATNVNAAWYALESMDKPVIWIAGGMDKGNDYEILKPLIKEKVRLIVCMGKDNRKIHAAFQNDVEMIVNTQSADEAVNVAYNLGRNGEVVLLSPACASFDLFEDYQDRGNQFKVAVKSL